MEEITISNIGQNNDIFETFDSIKHQFNLIFLKGINGITQNEILKLEELEQKLKDINLTFLSEKLRLFNSTYNSLLSSQNQKLNRENICQTAIKIISLLRTFERIMNIELVRENLMRC